MSGNAGFQNRCVLHTRTVCWLGSCCSRAMTHPSSRCCSAVKNLLFLWCLQHRLGRTAAAVSAKRTPELASCLNLLRLKCRLTPSSGLSPPGGSLGDKKNRKHQFVSISDAKGRRCLQNVYRTSKNSAWHAQTGFLILLDSASRCYPGAEADAILQAATSAAAVLGGDTGSCGTGCS